MSDKLDLVLLRKLASGEGGMRTGALKRAGLIEWTVTPLGYAKLVESGWPASAPARESDSHAADCDCHKCRVGL